MLDRIEVRGARQHNLRNIDVTIPRRSLTVVTGLSGSGKSSLAFDTIYAEGQRRYTETLSPYARQFLDQLERPDVDGIDGLSPALAIEQKTSSRSARSTVGTVTEIYDYLRIMFSSIGTPYCVGCDLPIRKQTSEQLASRITEENFGDKIMILAPCVRGRKGHYRKELEEWARRGFVVVRIDGETERLDNYPLAIRLNRNRTHTIEVVVDRLNVRQGIETRLLNSIRTASSLTDGLVLIVDGDGTERLYSEKLACSQCGASQPQVEPRTFSFNSRFGACSVCGGLGGAWDLDPTAIILDPNRPMVKGHWPTPAAFKEVMTHGVMVAEKAGMPVTEPWSSWTPPQREWFLYGRRHRLAGRQRVRVAFEGVINLLRQRLSIRSGERLREDATRYMAQVPCGACGGRRLSPESLAVKIEGHSISDLAEMPLRALSDVLGGMKLDRRKRIIAERVREEIRQRVAFLSDVGLGYLWLNRAANSLSGGEAQRVRLATQIGTRLRGVLYVLDEPSIGLHARDHDLLLDTLTSLRDLGNTIVVVEHDLATIRRADYVVDLGPGAGRLGGEVVAAGRPESLLSAENSLTGDYLAGRKVAHVPAAKKPQQAHKLVVRGARHHNLKGIDVPFPLGNLCVVTGVSGSGKSTLVNRILYPALLTRTRANDLPVGLHDRVEGLEAIDKVVRIDQTPIGRTPRSNPATYTGTFTPIREFFAMLPEARARGYRLGRFSFNVSGGRCDTCSGDGVKRIEMKFLPDVYVKCESCRGKRYNLETLQVRYKGKSISDLLEATVEEVLALMHRLPKVQTKLQTLVDVGLGYIQLGQSSTTISGGEAQRMKLARELSKRQTGRTVYVLDEPTTGLHFDDVRKLLMVLRRLVDKGNTVIVIEHQLDVIRSADWIVDLGPEGGDDGGEVVCVGTPEEVMKVEKSHTGRALLDMGTL